MKATASATITLTTALRLYALQYFRQMAQREVYTLDQCRR